MAEKRVDPFPTIPNLEPKPGLGIGDKLVNAVKGILPKPSAAPAMNAEQRQRAADLSVVHPSQRQEMNATLNDIDKKDLKIR